MLTFRPYKFLIIAVIQEVDEDGNVVRELNAENPTTVFGVDGLVRYAETFELDLSTSEEGTR